MPLGLLRHSYGSDRFVWCARFRRADRARV